MNCTYIPQIFFLIFFQRNGKYNTNHCFFSVTSGLIPVTMLKDIDVFKPEGLWDTARLAFGLTAIGGLLVDQVNIFVDASIPFSVFLF